MDQINPRLKLESMAQGSFSKVIERNEKTIFIEAKTEKVKHEVLKQFIDQAREDNYSDEDLVEMLLTLDKAIEDNTVRKTLQEFLKK